MNGGDGDYPTSQLACPTAPAPRCSCALRSPMQLCPASFTPLFHPNRRLLRLRDLRVGDLAAALPQMTPLVNKARGRVSARLSRS